MLRGLVSEAYGSQDKLIANLRRYYGDARVEQWLKSADAGDVLSGTMFSELASFFVSPDEYKDHYKRLFEAPPFLTLLRERRETLAAFLEHVRAIRDRLAHHKRISAVQISLLNLYFSAIIEPVQLAHDQSASKVNPEDYLEVGHDELERYVRNMRDDIQAVRDDLGVIGANVELIKATVEKTRTTVEHTGREVSKMREWLENNMKWVLLGIALLGAGIAGLFAITGGTLVNTEAIKGTTERIDKKMDRVKKETSEDPRKELANLGVNWDEGAMRKAVERGDLRTVSLFLQGGMGWTLYSAGNVLEGGGSPMIDLLIEHADQVQHVPHDCSHLIPRT